MRLRADDQSLAPAMCETFRWPRSSSSRVAAAAPATWSTATTGTTGLSRVVDRDKRYVYQTTVELACDSVLPGVDENTLD